MFLNHLLGLPVIDQVSKFQRLRKSNSIKILLQSFKSFMKEKGDRVVIEGLNQSNTKVLEKIRKEFSTFMRTKNANNETFLAISKSDRYKIYLKYYLEHYALDDLLESCSDSSLEDHITCLAFLIKSLYEKELIQHIVKYKKKHSSIGNDRKKH